MAHLVSSPALPFTKNGGGGGARNSGFPATSRLSTSATTQAPESCSTMAERVMMSMSSSSRRSLSTRCSPPQSGPGPSSSPGPVTPPTPMRQTFGFSPVRSSSSRGNSPPVQQQQQQQQQGGKQQQLGPPASHSSNPPWRSTSSTLPQSNSSSNIVELPGLLSRALLRTGGEGSSREGRAATEGGAEQQLPHALSSPLLHASPLRDQCTDSIGSAHRQMEAGPSPEPDFFPGVDKSLLRDLQERHSIFHTQLVANAFLLAAKAHEGQSRKDGSSQLSHSVLVGLQLAQLGLDAECVAAGLLHEALRSHNSALESQMEEFMPSSVMQLVNRVTAISEISCVFRNNRDKLNEEKWRRMLLAMEDVKAVLIKLACRVHDMRTCGALPRERQVSLAQETLDIFSVVANRLGIWCLKADLEDLAFAVIHPEEHRALSEQVAQRQDSEALEATITRIKAGLDARGVQYEDISGRPKNLYGIWQKMRSSGKSSLDQVYDVTALRVVVTNKHDCYVALRVVQELYRTMPSRSKDYIRGERKPNGYQSLHETIYGEGEFPVEVQFRTHKMHYIAEYGFAAHWKYKEKLSNEDEWLDKEVQYKKWLTMYKLGVHDKKVRPSGAPLQDCALKSLGVHLLHSADQSGGPYGDGSVAGAEQPGVDPFLRHDRFRLRAPTKASVNVVVQTQDGIDTRELAVGMTAGQLGVELGVPNLPRYVLTVNARLAPPGTILRSGDLIQVQPAKQVMSAMQQQPCLSPRQPVGGQEEEREQLVFLPGSPVPVRVVLPPSAAQRKAEKQQRVVARQQQRALQRAAAAEQQEREQLVYLPDSPIPMRVVFPSSSVPNSGGFGAGGSFLAQMLRGGFGKGQRRSSASGDTMQPMA
uniref:RelA/SpoT domain-containing protein n=1 Tax=Dunaliella tertiolecta TaxID=3047 RepID=A0A7S3R7J4_DUNTE